ncbi:hypothetical protein B0H16DRAFT_1741183 [Mycena metata]|uniref:Uncharacterized protein n=1 Tax=Mycena metata TaxID=1033252 RepID=A0AAD7MGZ5_9AGAR|nr:hypothetical protein B0H16DRAFT_1741183 [Mycena metata]
MKNYPATSSPNVGAAVNAAFDISTTVLATLTTAAQFAPLPFLQQASILALAILTTVRSAKDNKETFKALANDACELVSAIICVYNDMEKDGLKPSVNLKQRVEDLVSLLQSINQWSQKHAAKSMMARIVSVTSDNNKIQGYRLKLRQALDVFGLQSSITIHETVVQILAELRERDETKKDEGSQPSSPSSQPPSHPFGNLLQGNITGNVKINHISGNQEFHTTTHHTTIVDSYNSGNYSSRRQSSAG